MKRRALALKLSTTGLSLATAPGPVFAMLDPPGVVDAHGDTMDAGALRLPEPGEDGQRRVPLYYLHSYHAEVVAEATPSERVAIGDALLFEEGGYPYFVPRFFGNTDLSEETKRRLEGGEITAASIGYLIVNATPNGKGPAGTGENVHEARLIEVSLVDKGAKEGAVRIKAMEDADLKKLLEVLMTTRSEVAQMKTKAYAVEAMVGSPALYFAVEMMKHLAEAVTACQTYLMKDSTDPALADLARGAAASLGQMLSDLTTWLSSGAARGEKPSTAPATEDATAASGDAVTKWLQGLHQKLKQAS